MKNKKKISYHLVLTIVAEGNLEKIMDIAKESGIYGGTVLKGRELTNIIPKKILGFNIEEEKEIILNIVKDEDKNKFMKNISKEVGIKTEKEGICFSLPIDGTIGLLEE